VPKVWNDDPVPATLDLFNPNTIGFDIEDYYCAKFQVIPTLQGFRFIVLT